MTPLIRPATEDDIPAIADARTSVRENHLSVVQMAELGITSNTIADALRLEPCIWVAECDGRIVAFSMADAANACVFAAFVRPEWEGRGLGGRLMERAETFLFERHESIWLETDGASRAAGFYQRLGWSLTQTFADGDVRFEKHRPSSER